MLNLLLVLMMLYMILLLLVMLYMILPSIWLHTVHLTSHVAHTYWDIFLTVHMHSTLC